MGIVQNILIILLIFFHGIYPISLHLQSLIPFQTSVGEFSTLFVHKNLDPNVKYFHTIPLVGAFSDSGELRLGAA